ncbi:MAG TPA: alpha-L-rhamnosidase C-terminal domain-containing protein [Steroidobacteraceae bacterium]|nr:alpha-L-rhamnosidase C-terminal domain-containing protein [Steroidobacteraceae bacterium]
MRSLVVIFLLSLAVTARADDARGWITHPAAAATPVVLEFRRELDIDRVPEDMPVKVTADNRFILFVSGKRVVAGPSTGTVQRWRQTVIDLKPWLQHGKNVITATVWNFGDIAPAHQQSVATGFRLAGPPLSTSMPGWRVRLLPAHSAVSAKEQLSWQYYVASTPEIIDATKSEGEWVDAVPAPKAAVRTLIDDPLPTQTYTPAAAGRVVRASGVDASGFPSRPVTVPAHTTAKLLLRTDSTISAYPELDVIGGKAATIALEYGEALYDADNRKGDRDLVGDRRLRGFHDTFIADGQPRTFAPLWWRTFRYFELTVTTADEPLTLQGLRLTETGYPFGEVASFRSNDAQLNRIWDIGWRTLRVDAHETFMDSSYWEQLQYTGDTRLEMLISYAVSGDSRLAREAIESFAESDTDGGLVQGAYPSRLPNVIATFSFAWIGMLSDWSNEQPDAMLVQKHLPRVRRVLQWFEPLRNSDGLLGKNPKWNFIDWAGQRWDDRDHFPSWGRNNGSCLMTAMWVGALRQGAELERRHGDVARAKQDDATADAARTAIREHCWVADRGLFADDGDRDVFSQHMNVLAILYDIATPAEAATILDKITVRDRGIDAPVGMYMSSYYFAWYLARAAEHAGKPERYLELLKSWRDLLPLNYTTWPESRDQPRSDSHAWSAHPTADLLGLVAGIRSGAPGYARVRVEPVLGALTSLDATAATPKGPVSVSYRVAGGKLVAVIERPADLAGEFVWKGKPYPLERQRTRLELPL